jgi:hypothetical protein
VQAQGPGIRPNLPPSMRPSPFQRRVSGENNLPNTQGLPARAPSTESLSGPPPARPVIQQMRPAMQQMRPNLLQRPPGMPIQTMERPPQQRPTNLPQGAYTTRLNDQQKLPQGVYTTSLNGSQSYAGTAPLDASQQGKPPRRAYPGVPDPQAQFNGQPQVPQLTQQQPGQVPQYQNQPGQVPQYQNQPGQVPQYQPQQGQIPPFNPNQQPQMGASSPNQAPHRQFSASQQQPPYDQYQGRPPMLNQYSQPTMAAPSPLPEPTRLGAKGKTELGRSFAQLGSQYGLAAGNISQSFNNLSISGTPQVLTSNYILVE